jgi:hypothetical protein
MCVGWEERVEVNPCADGAWGHLHDPDLHLLHQLQREHTQQCFQAAPNFGNSMISMKHLHLLRLQLEQFWNIPQHTVGVRLIPPLSENANQSGSSEFGTIPA